MKKLNLRNGIKTDVLERNRDESEEKIRRVENPERTPEGNK